MSIRFPVLSLIFISGVAFAQSDYDSRMLETKRMFSQRALQALNEPFVGVTSDGSVRPGLFPIRVSGVSTTPVIEAARQFLASLEPDQKVRSVFSVQDSEWRSWSNVDNGIFLRQGVSLKEMTGEQRKAAMDLMRKSLSAKGLQLSLDIMKTDQTLREINDDVLSYDEELYFFTLMGLPSATEPWGWQIDGHHLIINYFLLGDQVVMTPVFLGGEPVKARTGKYAGNHILQEEQNSGLAMMQALDDEQKTSATLASTKKHNNNRGEANKDNLVLEYEGIPVTRFSDEQKTQLLDLIGLFVRNLREGHADIRMDEVAAHLDETWFTWIGAVAGDAVFYYRIHSPVILIEFDHQFPVGTSRLNKERKPTRDHIHVVIRTPNGNDYGKDLLRQHLEAHPH
jgi:hypothetical protein